jgi:hypothetical protein
MDWHGSSYRQSQREAQRCKCDERGHRPRAIATRHGATSQGRAVDGLGKSLPHIQLSNAVAEKCAIIRCNLSSFA